METEIPAMLNARPDHYGEDFTFHSSRMRMQSVTQEELEQMDEQSERCTTLLSDARCDVLAYACLIGIMAQGPGYHEESETMLHQRTVDNDAEAPVVTSAGALVRALERLEAEEVALIAPYVEELTGTMIDYFESRDMRPIAQRVQKAVRRLGSRYDRSGGGYRCMYRFWTDASYERRGENFPGD